MKKILSKKIILSISIILAIILINGNVHAVGGQASGTSSLYSKTVSYFFELIRAMETPTGTLGVNSNINTTTYVDSSGNGIDCHLEKNTEYGTIALLAASEYGNKTSTDSASTALGATGVFQMNNGKYEYVANTWSSAENGTPTTNRYNRALTSADARYVNKYYGTKDDFTSRGYVIKGDGLIQTDGWGDYTYFVHSYSPVFSRGNPGLFGYLNDDGDSDSSNGARAVVVCGAGL